MNRRPRSMQFSTQCVVIGKLAMVRFGVRVGRGAHGLKIIAGQWRFVLRQGMPGRSAGREQNDYDERRENGEGKAAKLGVGQGGNCRVTY